MSDSNLIFVKKYVEEIIEGKLYKGDLKIANTEFDFELCFGFPIKELKERSPTKKIKERRRLFQISIKKEEKEINLSDDEYEYFWQMLVEFVVLYYVCARYPRADSRATASQGSDCGSIRTIGFAKGGIFEFPHEFCQALSAEKFGCNFD